MNAEQTPEENRQLQAMLRPNEEILWQGCGLDCPHETVKPPTGLLQRLRALCTAAAPPVSGAPHSTKRYILTSKRVLQLQDGCLTQEWPLMLGMIQKVENSPDGSGSIIFDYIQPAGSGEPQACGILQVEDVAAVHAKLAAAIDAAYLASPWT